MNTQVNTSAVQGSMTKVARYKWQVIDKPGKMQMIHKGILNIDPEYQRDAVALKVYEFSNKWSWLGAGVITVGHRDGEYWVIDGQHRVLAAKRRADIDLLPCLVFETKDISQEAEAFLMANSRRKPISSFDKQKAMVVAGDDTAVFVENTCKKIGLKLGPNSTAVGCIRAVNWCYRKAEEDRDSFVKVLTLAAEITIAAEMHVNERLLDGLWYLNRFCGDGLNDKRLVRRIKEKGATKLLMACQKAAAYYGKGGGNIFADGMLSEINKGLSIKFELSTGKPKEAE